MSVMATAMDAWRKRSALGDGNKSRELAAFLPAALEIQETPPNPLARWLARAVLALVVLAVAWAWVGRVNIVATAEGKIVPSSRVKQVQPLEKSVVKAILVANGDYVTKGQPLIELDSTLSGADEKRLLAERQATALRLAVNQALLERLDRPEADTRPHRTLASHLQVGVTDRQMTVHVQLLERQWAQYAAQLHELESALAKNRAEQAVSREVIAKLEQTVPIVSRRADKMRELHEKSFAAETDYLRLEQERIQQVRDLAAERHRATQIEAAQAELGERIKAHVAQTGSTLLSAIADDHRQMAALEEELIKASDKRARQVLYAPVSGRVQELAVNTVGGVVTEAQQLMLVVPDEERLEAEAFLENKDVGFVRQDMPAEIKVHTFPFTKYGVIDAEVTHVSDDAIVDEQRGLIYRVQFRLEKGIIDVDGKSAPLIPGMAVTAEVQTGERRIMEFFLAPLLKRSAESMRER